MTLCCCREAEFFIWRGLFVPTVLKNISFTCFFFFFLVSHINICIGTWPLCLEETSPRARSWNISKMHCFLNSVVRWKDLVLISVFILPLSLSLAFTQCQPPLALIKKKLELVCSFIIFDDEKRFRHAPWVTNWVTVVARYICRW